MTLKEVARLAGVSPSAVSRYLNGGPLSGEKSASIRRVIERTGYVPNQAAPTLRTGRIREASGYLPVLGATSWDRERERRYLETMQAYHVAGIILMASDTSAELAAACKSCTVPVVVTGQRVPGLHCVCHDDRGAMRALTERVLARGRRSIGYITVGEEDTAVGAERLRGAREALEAAGLPPECLAVETGSFQWESGRTCTRRLLEARPDLDAVLCATDTIALGAMLALREAGRRMPEDVSVAGVGDDWADYIAVPQLTSARLGQVRCGRKAAEILLRLMKDPDAPPVQTVLPFTIAERGSI